MNFYQWALFAMIFALIFNKASKVDAIILLFVYSVYQLFVIDLPGVYYYSVSAALNLVAANLLYDVNKDAALCSCLLVFANLIGFFIWGLYFPPTIYNNLSFVILTLQLIAIIPKGLLNGLGNYIKHIVAKFACFDGVRAFTAMLKSKAQKGQNQ